MKDKFRKVLFFVFINFMLVVMLCCNNRNVNMSRLKSADSLLDAGDMMKAKAILDSINAVKVSMSTKQLMYLQLLQTSWKNKNFVDIAGDTVMETVANYYDKHGSVSQRVKSYYLLGCVYRDQQKPIKALEIFQKAEDIANKSKPTDADYRLLMSLYGQTSFLYADQKLPDRTLEELDKMQKYAYLAKDTLFWCYGHYNKASAYFSRGQMDSVLKVCYECNRLFMKYGYESNANKLWLPAISILLERGETSRAKELIDLFENKSGLFDADANIDPEYVDYYYDKGLYFLGVNRIDSAEYYFRKLLPYINNKDNYNNAQAAYRGLFMVYERLGNVDSISKYARAWCDANDSSLVRVSAEKIQHIRSAYDYTEHKKMAYEKAEEARLLKYRIATVLVILVFVILVMWLLMRRWKQIHTAEKRRLNELYAETLADYDKLKIIMDDQHHSNSRQMEELQKEADRLKDIIKHIRPDVKRVEEWNDEATLIYSDAVRNMHSYAMKGVAPYSLWNDVTELSKRYIPMFMDRIGSDEYQLNDIEQKISLLIRLKFNLSEIKNLLALSSQNLTNIRSGINKKLFNDNSAKRLDSNIKDI